MGDPGRLLQGRLDRVNQRGQVMWTLGGNRVVGEESVSWIEVAEGRKSPIARKKSDHTGSVEDTGRNTRLGIL